MAGRRLSPRIVKWTARDFAAEAEGVLPMGQPTEEWLYGDLEAGFDAAALVLDESFVTAGLSHQCMEPRTAMAYWENGKCHLHGSSQSQASMMPGLARLLAIEPENVVYIAEYCGGGFGSKGGPYPVMAIPALMSRQTGRPVMLRISRAEEYGLGTARAGFQGRLRMGFRDDGRVTAVDLFIVQENGPHTGWSDLGSAAILAIEPENVVYIAEYCGGGFGSKGGPYPVMAIPALMSRQTGRPVMLRISRAEEYGLGTARAGFQGRLRMGFRDDGRVTAVDLFIVQENGPHTGWSDLGSAAGSISIQISIEPLSGWAERA